MGNWPLGPPFLTELVKGGWENQTLTPEARSTQERTIWNVKCNLSFENSIVDDEIEIKLKAFSMENEVDVFPFLKRRRTAFRQRKWDLGEHSLRSLIGPFENCSKASKKSPVPFYFVTNEISSPLSEKWFESSRKLDLFLNWFNSHWLRVVKRFPCLAKREIFNVKSRTFQPMRDRDTFNSK